VVSLTLWELGGAPVSMAALTRRVAGMVRVGPVYTPPELRGHGYASAVTAEVSRAALADGAEEVLLCTDLANPVSNSIYQHIGYRPVEDRRPCVSRSGRPIIGGIMLLARRFRFCSASVDLTTPADAGAPGSPSMSALGALGKHVRMGWCTTRDLDLFLTVADGYLTSRAAENTLLLSAAHQARAVGDGGEEGTPGRLFGWWEPPDGGGPRGAFLHDPAAPLLIAGRAPETAAALATELGKAGLNACGVDAPAAAADAFAAAWSQRTGVAVRVHRHSRVYRIAGVMPAGEGPAGRPRVATGADRPLLVEWLRAFRTEVGQLTGAPEATADELLGYAGATFWEAGGSPVALAAVTRPVARTVRVSMVYTPPELRHRGYAAAVSLAVSQAALAGPGGAGPVSEVVLITDAARPLRQATRMGYELIGERALLSFGPPTGPMPRLPTGPVPRLRG
jgi:predicted GNAT family acetyltransferase